MIIDYDEQQTGLNIMNTKLNCDIFFVSFEKLIRYEFGTIENESE
jgi:hypothetical protein